MTFLHPLLLGAGLACIAIPIAIHLLMRRRRRPVRWAAMRFLLEAYRRKQRRLRLEQILLLAARCLLIALIGLAIARPMLGHAGPFGGGSQDLYLLIDNSIASAQRDESGETRLDRSIEQALAMLARLESGRGDRAALITLAGEAEGIVLPPSADLATVERRLRELQPTDAPMDLAGGLSLVSTDAETPGSGVGRTVVVASGFSEGAVGRAPVLPALGQDVRLTATDPQGQAAGNVGVATAEVLRPVLVTGAEGGPAGAAGQIRVELVRSGDGVDRAGATQVRVVATSAQGGRREVGAAGVVWSRGQTAAEVAVDIDAADSLDRGRALLQIEIDRDGNERDNVARAVLQVRARLGVAIVGTRRFGSRPRISEFGPSDWLAIALSPGPDGGGDLRVETIDATRLAPEQLAGFDAVVVAEPDRVRAAGWEAIGAFAATGGAVVVCAAPVAGAQSWTEPMILALGLSWRAEREPVDPAEPALVVPPAGPGDPLWFLRSELDELAATVRVERVLPVSTDEASSILLVTASGEPVLLAGRAGGGGAAALLATAIDLAWTDLPARPLMVPLMQELIRAGVGNSSGVRSVAAGSRLVLPAGTVEAAMIEPRDAGVRTVSADAATGLSRSPVLEAGLYEARNAADQVVGVVAVQPHADAGRAGSVDRARVQSWLASSLRSPEAFSWTSADAGSSGAGAEARRPTDAGPGLALLAAALAVGLIEVGLARLVSHASASPGASAAAEGGA